MRKSDFPLFDKEPDIAFLDNGASTQKPRFVIDAVSDFVSYDYANIHRGMYAVSERAEEAYHHSKQLVAKFIGASASEIIYTYNATYGINLLAQSLVRSRVLGKGDVVLLGLWEHHANVLPWQILAEEYGFEVHFVPMTADYDLDREKFVSMYNESYAGRVKVVVCGHVSNVTGAIIDLARLSNLLHEETFFLVDGSQSIPHFAIDVKHLWCDAFVFTGHKMMAYTGIGAVYLEKSRIKRLSPMIAGGGTVDNVTEQGHVLVSSSDKFEAGTPNIIGAVSLGKALEYIDMIWGMEAIEAHEQHLVKYVFSCLEQEDVQGKLVLVGPSDPSKRVWVFSFVFPSQKNVKIIWEKFAEANVCVRCGGHCAYPLHHALGYPGTCRMSTYLYNDEQDIDRFFDVVRDF